MALDVTEPFDSVVSCIGFGSIVPCVVMVMICVVVGHRTFAILARICADYVNIIPPPGGSGYDSIIVIVLIKRKRQRSAVVMALLLVVVIVTACGDNSIDTRVEERPGSSLKFPVELTDVWIEAGKSVYTENCAACHGPVNGPTVLGSATVHGDAGHTWHHPDRLLHQWILDKPPLATVMPAFRGNLSDEQVMQVLAYIKSHWLPEIQARQNEGSVQYEAQVVEFRAE